jgi:hypothetical protein
MGSGGIGPSILNLGTGWRLLELHAPGTHWIQGWVIITPANISTLAVQPVAWSLYWLLS